MVTRILEGPGAKAFGQKDKWEQLSPFLKQYGQEALAYATLQEGMEYFIDDDGYIAYTSVYHPVFARKTKKIALSDPVCAPENYTRIVGHFLESNPHAAFAVISEPCAQALRGLGFKANCLGYEPELSIQTYNTKGNWKEFDLIKRARNEARREGIVIREEDGACLDKAALSAVSAKWISSKKDNDRQIWIYARLHV